MAQSLKRLKKARLFAPFTTAFCVYNCFSYAGSETGAD
jgi:hypothetical protein